MSLRFLRKLKYQFLRLSSFISGNIAHHRLSLLKPGETYGVVNKVTFVDQLREPDPQKVEKYFGRIADIEAAIRFGTEDVSEYSFWSWRSCGIACVSMILQTEGCSTGSMYDLVTESKNGYLHEDAYGNRDIGWKYSALVDLLEKHGMNAKIYKLTGLPAILSQVAKGRYAIISIKSRLSEHGRHLILLTGFVWSGPDTIVTIVDPYTLDGNGGVKDMKLKVLSDIFLKRGIIVWKS